MEKFDDLDEDELRNLVGILRDERDRKRKESETEGRSMTIPYDISEIKIEQRRPMTVRERLDALVGVWLSPSKCQEIWALLRTDEVRAACREDAEIRIMVENIASQVGQEEMRRLAEAEHDDEQFRREYLRLSAEIKYFTQPIFLRLRKSLYEMRRHE